MLNESIPRSDMEQISTEGPTFLIRRWVPLTPLIFVIVFVGVNSKHVWGWNRETVGQFVTPLVFGLCLSFLIRYLVSDFADVVWVNNSHIRFEKDGQTETMPLSNIEELRSCAYFPLLYPFSQKPYRIRLRFQEPIGMGESIQFFLRGPGLHSKTPREELERLLNRIQSAQ